MSALEKQVDGTHYNKLKIQPIQLGYALNATPCFVKLAKYLTRDKDDKLVQLTKALHVIELEEELLSDDHMYYMESHGSSMYGSVEDSTILVDFCNQFEHDEIIYRALNHMSGQWYVQAREAVAELLEVYKCS